MEKGPTLFYDSVRTLFRVHFIGPMYITLNNGKCKKMQLKATKWLTNYNLFIILIV